MFISVLRLFEGKVLTHEVILYTRISFSELDHETRLQNISDAERRKKSFLNLSFSPSQFHHYFQPSFH